MCEKWWNHCLKPDFESEQVRHLLIDFGLFCIFGKVFESTLRAYQWEVGIAIFGFGIWERVLKNVRKMVKLVLRHDFKPHWVRHFWTDFLLVCRFGKVFESTLRIFQWHVYIALFSTVMCPCQTISYPSFGLFLYISAAILFFAIFSLSPFQNLWPMVWLIDYNILNCKKINSACLRLFQGQFPPLPDHIFVVKGNAKIFVGYAQNLFDDFSFVLISDDRLDH